MTPTELKSLRAALGWSQARLAEALGVQRNTVNRWEMGTNPIPPMAEKLLSRIWYVTKVKEASTAGSH